MREEGFGMRFAHPSLRYDDANLAEVHSLKSPARPQRAVGELPCKGRGAAATRWRSASGSVGCRWSRSDSGAR